MKSRYRRAQIKAAVKVNAEQLLFNWQLGRDLVIRKAEEKWGAGVVEQVSMDLQASFPESKGFSTSNLWRMKQWYLFYAESEEKLAQAGREFTTSKKLAQAGREFTEAPSVNNNGVPFPDYFAYVPWKHHVEIVTKSKTIEEALFYILKCATEGWSRNTLANCIKADYYHSSGGAISNFSEKLPLPQSDLAQAITKDTYDFGFISLPKGYEEEQLETELEKQLIIAGKTRKLDMLFFHIPLNCYIVIELKAVPFQPEFAGKLNFYVNAVDDLIKTPAQNPTIGLLICSNKEETEVQYAFNASACWKNNLKRNRIKILNSQLRSSIQLFSSRLCCNSCNALQRHSNARYAPEQRPAMH